MPMYRKKPVVIEALRIRDAIRALARVGNSGPDWLYEAGASGVLVSNDMYLEIVTLEGTMRGEWNDYLIRGVHQELYPCKPDIFDATYEAVDDAHL